MEITGKLKKVLKSELTKNGKKWSLPVVLDITTDDKYPKELCLIFYNNENTTFGVPLGSEIKIQFDLKSNEFNGKYYTNATAFKYTVIKEAKEVEPNYNELPPDFYGEK